MSLIHDPSAIRYASTQEAYGTTWTLDRIESDGAQLWKNAKGETAMVQQLPEEGMSLYIQGQVYQDVSIQLPVSVPSLDITFDSASDFTVQGTITAYFPHIPDWEPTNEQTISEIDRLTASGRAGKYAKTLEGCKQAMQSGRVSSTEENVSNGPKSEQAIEIDLRQVHRAMYLSPVDLAIQAREAKRKPGETRVSADAQKRWTWNGTRWDKS